MNRADIFGIAEDQAVLAALRHHSVKQLPHPGRIGSTLFQVDLRTLEQLEKNPIVLVLLTASIKIVFGFCLYPG